MACSGGRFVPGLLLALSLFFPSPPAALAEARGAAPVENFLLGNGMEVVVIPDHRAPVVTHMVWYKIGSADEPPGKSGIAHFFEHLMFKGTPAHPAGTFSAEVDAIGGNENAATSYDYTYYYQTVSPDALPKMMAFEADRMRNLVLTDQVIGPERDVILEERRMRIESSPDALLSEEVQATLYQNHPYRVPVIGWMQEIEALNRTDAVDFYDRYYAPNNAILVVAGDTDPREVRRLAEETYGKVPRGPNLPPRKRPQEPEQNTSRTVTMSDPRVTLPSVAAYWVVPSYRSAADGEAEALDLLSEILGGGSRSRFFQELVKSGKAAGAGASYDGTALDATGFVVYGAPLDSASLGAVEDGLWREIDRLISDGVDETELKAAKGRYVRAMIFAQDSPSSMADIYGSSLATGETVRDVQEWPARIKAVTAAEVQAAARKYLRRDIAVTAYLLPKAAEASR